MPQENYSHIPFNETAESRRGRHTRNNEQTRLDNIIGNIIIIEDILGAIQVRPMTNRNDELSWIAIPRTINIDERSIIQKHPFLFGVALLIIVVAIVSALILWFHSNQFSEKNIIRALIAERIDSNRLPFGVSNNFPFGTKRLYYYVSYKDAIPNKTTLEFHCYKNGALLSKSEPFILKYTTGNFFSKFDYDFQPGQYQVRLYSGGSLINVVSFNISNGISQKTRY